MKHIKESDQETVSENTDQDAAKSANWFETKVQSITQRFENDKQLSLEKTEEIRRTVRKAISEIYEEFISRHRLHKIYNLGAITEYALTLTNPQDVQAIMIMTASLSIESGYNDSFMKSCFLRMHEHLLGLYKSNSVYVGGDYVVEKNVNQCFPKKKKNG